MALAALCVFLTSQVPTIPVMLEGAEVAPETWTQIVAELRREPGFSAVKTAEERNNPTLSSQDVSTRHVDQIELGIWLWGKLTPAGTLSIWTRAGAQIPEQVPIVSPRQTLESDSASAVRQISLVLREAWERASSEPRSISGEALIDWMERLPRRLDQDRGGPEVTLTVDQAEERLIWQPQQRRGLTIIWQASNAAGLVLTIGIVPGQSGIHPAAIGILWRESGQLFSGAWTEGQVGSGCQTYVEGGSRSLLCRLAKLTQASRERILSLALDVDQGLPKTETSRTLDDQVERVEREVDLDDPDTVVNDDPASADAEAPWRGLFSGILRAWAPFPLTAGDVTFGTGWLPFPWLASLKGGFHAPASRFEISLGIDARQPIAMAEPQGVARQQIHGFLDLAWSPAAISRGSLDNADDLYLEWGFLFRGGLGMAWNHVLYEEQPQGDLFQPPFPISRLVFHGELGLFFARRPFLGIPFPVRVSGGVGVLWQPGSFLDAFTSFLEIQAFADVTLDFDQVQFAISLQNWSVPSEFNLSGYRVNDMALAVNHLQIQIRLGWQPTPEWVFGVVASLDSESLSGLPAPFDVVTLGFGLDLSFHFD